MKDVELIKYKVVNGEKREKRWVEEGDKMSVILKEYVKYMGEVVRIGRE